MESARGRTSMSEGLATDDETYQEYLMERYSFTCVSDFPVIGYQPGEKTCTMLRVLCTLITVR